MKESERKQYWLYHINLFLIKVTTCHQTRQFHSVFDIPGSHSYWNQKFHAQYIHQCSNRKLLYVYPNYVQKLCLGTALSLQRTGLLWSICHTALEMPGLWLDILQGTMSLKRAIAFPGFWVSWKAPVGHHKSDI